jgi:hypothetical protein
MVTAFGVSSLRCRVPWPPIPSLLVACYHKVVWLEFTLWQEVQINTRYYRSVSERKINFYRCRLPQTVGRGSRLLSSSSSIWLACIDSICSVKTPVSAFDIYFFSFTSFRGTTFGLKIVQATENGNSDEEWHWAGEITNSFQ